MTSGPIQRAQILLEQSRWGEARDYLEEYLSEHPNDFFGRYYLIIALIELGDKERSRLLADQLLEDAPEEPVVIGLSANVDMADEKFESAESKADLLIEMEPENARAYELKARANFGKRNYDRALESVNRALALDPENVDALNLKILVSGFIRGENTKDVIEEALQLDPNDPSTIANQGYQLVKEGKVTEALERLQYALSLEPTNQLARYAMIEALRSRFWPYRWFLKYKEAASKLSARGSWTLIIGVYIAYRFLIGLSRRNPELSPFLSPLIYTILFLFILTWVIDPLINLYLLTNKYGRVLLDRDEKRMAQYTGISFLIVVLAALAYFTSNNMFFGELAILAFGMMIPLGTFLKPRGDKNRQITLLFTLGMLISGLLGLILNVSSLWIGFLFALFIYQWVINGLMIKENARVFD